MPCLNCHFQGIERSMDKCLCCGVYLPALLKNLLPKGTLLRDGTDAIDYPLGRGSFGITYQACHRQLATAIAIKEFYPQE
jgi:hypothetical protein